MAELRHEDDEHGEEASDDELGATVEGRALVRLRTRCAEIEAKLAELDERMDARMGHVEMAMLVAGSAFRTGADARDDC